MNQAEKKFNSWLREQLPGDYMRVENTTMLGVPDINVCYQGNEVWIESKIHYAKHDSPLLEKEQHAWGFRRAHNGGTVFVMSLDEETALIRIYQHPLEVAVQGEYLKIVSLPKHVWHKKDFLHYSGILFE